MSQYIQQNSQRFFSTTYQYTGGQPSHFTQQSQHNPMIRESSLNRNNSIGSGMTLKSGKIQDHFAGKIKRDSNMRNSVDFKENDPYTKNTILAGHINKINGNLRDSMEMVSEYDTKNSYCNPLIMKRERNSHQISRQKLIPNQCMTNRGDLSQNSHKNKQTISKEGFSQLQYDSLIQRVTKLQSVMKENGAILTLHSSKLQKLQEFYHQKPSEQHQIRSSTNKSQKNQNPPSSQTKNRHSRSTTGNMSASPTFKQLSQIMNLIQQSKNYQIKNAQQYRKMIEEFRSTILEFREELNKAVKRADIEEELAKMREIVAKIGNGSNINANNLNNGNSLLSRKGSHNDIFSSTPTNASSLTLSSHSKQSLQSQTLQKIRSQILTLKSVIQKLEQNNMSLKADLVKSNVREKKFCEQVNSSLFEVNKKLLGLSKQIVPFNLAHMKRGHRNQGLAICFRVSQQLRSCLIPKPPMLSKSAHIPSYSPEHATNPAISCIKRQQSPTQSSLRHSYENALQQINNESSSQMQTECSSSQMLTISSRMYYIDRDGYLLDKDSYYLLNQRNQQIRLSQQQIVMLRRLKVMQQ